MKFIFIYILQFFYLFKADLPIDCLKSETVGVWQFDISDLKYHEFYVENTCGHYGITYNFI